MIHTMAVKQRRTMIVVLHQPTSEMFEHVDSLCLMVHGGRQAFFGKKEDAPTFFTSVCGLAPYSLDQYIEKLAAPPGFEKETAYWSTLAVDRFAESTYAESLGRDIVSYNQQLPVEYGPVDIKEWRSNFARQLKWLLWRTISAHRRNPMRTTKLASRLVFTALLVGVLFFQLRPTKNGFEQNLNAVAYFMFIIVANSDMSLLLIDIPGERGLIIRDYKRRTYTLTAYCLARFITDTAYVIVTGFVYTLVIVVLVDMKQKALVICIVITLVLACCGFAWCIASLAPTPRLSLLLLQPTQMPLFQFSGYMINLKSLPAYISWFRYLTYYYYSFSLVMLTQWSNIPCSLYLTNSSSINSSISHEVCLRSGNEVLLDYGVNMTDFNFNFLMLFILAVVLHIAGYLMNAIRIMRNV